MRHIRKREKKIHSKGFGEEFSIFPDLSIKPI
jgi:hypothetical protein